MTHGTPEPKTSLDLLWKAPSDYQGDVLFRFGVASAASNHLANWLRGFGQRFLMLNILSSIHRQVYVCSKLRQILGSSTGDFTRPSRSFRSSCWLVDACLPSADDLQPRSNIIRLRPVEHDNCQNRQHIICRQHASLEFCQSGTSEF